jgi:IMP and pyridine-specific 5'-nucleotidase
MPAFELVRSHLHEPGRTLQGLHVGDRFTASGNDSATRDCCSILWVANPDETAFYMKLLLSDIHFQRMQPYIE